MKRILILTMTALLSILFLTACAQDEPSLPTRAALAELDAPTVQPEIEETAVQPTASPPPSTETESGERPSLPNLADTAVDTGLGGGLDNNITIAEGTSAAETANLFGATTFALNTPLPTGITEAQVWQQSAVILDENRAKAIAARWGFSGPLYQLAPPDKTVVGETVGLDAAQLPANLPEYHVFDGARSLVITEGAAYFVDSSVPFDYESPQSFAQRAPAAEAVLQSMGLLDFDYALAAGWGHEVWVNRILADMTTDFPEISVGVNENGRLAFASYQPFDQLTAVGTYPLISAETAWQQIQAGLDENMRFTITSAAAEQDSALPPQAAGFQYWPREQQSGPDVHLYSVPTVFLPVDEGLPPLVNALNYTVQADETTLRDLAAQVGVNVHFWGTLDTNTNILVLAGWEPLPELNPLIKNGTVQRQGEETLLIEPQGGTFSLPNAPADLADGSHVNVFAWATRETGQAYPVLDWEGIDLQIPGSSGEAMAMPEMLPAAAPVYEQISINTVTLAYYAYPEMQTGQNGRFQQSYWLLPVWQFTGIANNGDTVTFTVQAAVQPTAQ
jgi:hypothetical protein